MLLLLSDARRSVPCCQHINLCFKIRPSKSAAFENQSTTIIVFVLLLRQYNFYQSVFKRFKTFKNGFAALTAQSQPAEETGNGV